MIIRQSRQVKHARVVLSAALLALALTIVPSTAFADEPVEDEQLVVVDEEQTPADGQAIPADDPAPDNVVQEAPVDEQEAEGEVVIGDVSESTIVDGVVAEDDREVAVDHDGDGPELAGEADQVAADDTTSEEADEAAAVVAYETAAMSLNTAKPVLLGTPPEGEGDEPEQTTIPEEYSLSGGVYYIGSGLDDTTAAKFLEVASETAANSVNVRVSSFRESDSQKWELQWDDVNGAYVIYLYGTSQAYALDLSGAVTANKRNIQIYTANGSKAQLWTILQQASGAYTISSFLDPTYVLDIAGGKYSDSTNVQLYTSNGSKAQSYYLFDVATGPDTTPETETLSGNTYLIQTGLKGATGVQVLDVKGGKTANSTNVQTYTYNKSDAQKWDFMWDEINGAYVIGVHGTDFAYVLDINGGVAANGRNVQIFKANGSAAQLWHVTKTGDTYTLSSYIDPSFTIDVAGAKYANSTNVWVFTANGSKAQSYYLVNTAPVVEGESPDKEGEWQGVWTVASAKDGSYVIDLVGGSYSNSANVQLYKGNGTAAQRFYFEPTGDGYYFITIIGTGKVLDVAGAKILPGTNVQQFTRNGSDAQKWAVRDNGDGTVTIVNKGTGLVLDVSGGKMANGTNILGYLDNGTAAQQYSLTPTPFITDGIYEIRSYKSTGSVIDIKGASASSGAFAQVYADNDSLAQRFQVVTVGNDEYLIRTAASGGWLTGHAKAEQVTQEGSSATQTSADVWKAVWNGTYFSLENADTGFVLDLYGGKTTNGTSVQTFTANGTTAQFFFFVPADLIKPGLYEIHSGFDTKYNLDVNGASASAGANIQIYTDNSTIAQMYTIEKSGTGYKLINAKSGLAVTGGSSSGTNVAQQTFTGASTQIWIPVIADGGFVVFQNAANTNVVLDVAGDTAANGKNVQVETADGSSGQKWKLDPVKTGWYKINNHWQYISVDPRAHFDYDLDSTGKSLGHYDVLYRLWYRVNGYKSGSKKPYGSNTNYLIVSAWDDCYLGVFVGVGNPNSAGYWQPLYGWNCGNGNRNVINEDARKQAEREGRTTTWSWDPEWDYALALNNDTASRDNLPDNNQWARPLSSSNYRLLRIPNNNMERYFTSVRMTLGYHSTITSNPSSELGRHVSHGCIRLDVNNARTLYALMGTKGKTTKDLNGNVITYSNGQAVVGVGPGTRCIQLSSSKGSY